MKKIDKKNIEDILELTPMQAGMLFHYLRDPQSDHYFEQLSLEISGGIDGRLFEPAWNFVIETNEMLRAVFRWEEVENPVQVILKEHQFQPQYYDFSGIDAVETEKQLEDVKVKDRKKKFDLREVPFRVTLYKIEENKYEMIISSHHILYDGWSNGIILREFFDAYNRLSNGKELQRPVKTKFREFVKWNQNRNIDNQEKFWKDYLKGFDTPTELSVKRRRKRRKRQGTPSSGDFHISLPKNVTIELENFVKKHRITLASLLYAAWGILLQKYCNSGDVIFGTTVSGRSAPIKGIGDMVGLFINTIPLRVKTVIGEKIIDLLCKINHILRLRETHESTPLVDIKRTSELKNIQEIFNSIVVLENYPLERHLKQESRNRQLSINSFSMFEMTNYDLTVTLLIYDDIEVNFIYNKELFDKEAIARLSNHFTHILHQVCFENSVEKGVHQLDILSEVEKIELLFDFNNTKEKYPKEETIHKLFEEQVDKIPDNIGVIAQSARRPVQGNGRPKSPDRDTLPCAYTYRELNKRSNQLAFFLKEKGVGSDNIVAIMVERSFEMVVGIMGILKAGGAYLTIDPEYPQERIVYMLKDSSARILVSDKNDLETGHCPVPVLDLIQTIHCRMRHQRNRKMRKRTPPAPASVTTLAYVLYTSGSTGRPKGVLVQHCSVVNILLALFKKYPLLKEDTYLLKTTYTFDVSVSELFGWYLGGGRLAILEPGGEKDPLTILDWIERIGVTHINFVPSMFGVFLEILNSRKVRQLSNLIYIFLAGEALAPHLVTRFNEYHTGILLENIYGPTENTIYTSQYSLLSWRGVGSIPIGKPLSNIRLYIFNSNHQLQPIGVPGELSIGGEGLARGYLNRPELTAEKFDHDLWDYLDYQLIKNYKLQNTNYKQITNHKLQITNKTFHQLARNGASSSKKLLRGVQRGSFLEKRPSGRRRQKLYKTGDLARWQADGNVEFLGRIDRQIKVRGFRIELGEIENQLLKHGEIREAVVLAREDEVGDNRYLCAYIVPALSPSSEAFDVTGLKNDLLKFLPDYMIPSYFVRIDEVPLTPTGKTDRKVLPKPEIKTIKKYIAPRNKREALLVEIWSRVLGIEKEKIGIDDNFFELGGDSLKIASLIGRIHRDFDIEIPFSVLFATPTIRKIYHYMNEAETRIHHSIPWIEEKEYYPLVPTQKRFYVFQQFKPDDISYNMTETMLMEGQLSRERFEDVFRQLLFRQESLRTSFHMIKGEPVQKIHQEVEFVIEYDELDKEGTMGLAPLSLEPAARKPQLAASFIRPFDLTRPPLWRVRLVKTAPEKHLLMFDMHHLIADGTSLGIFISDFLSIYKQVPLPPLKVRYRDYLEWQRWRREQARKISWEAPGHDQPEDQLLNLPTDFPRPVEPTVAGKTIRFDMGVKESGALHQLSIRQDVTLYILLLAVYNVLLSKLSGQENIAVGSPIAGRVHVDLDHMTGLFLNILCLRNQPSSQKTFSTFLQEVKARVISAFENQDYQYDELVAQVTRVQDKGRNPLFDVMLVLQNMEIPEIDIDGLRVTRNVGEQLASKFDMTLYCEEKDQLVFWLEYSTALFKPGTIKRFIRYFQQIISRVLQDPHQKIADIEMIPGEEKKQILYEFNDTEADYPHDQTIHHLFAQQAERTPDRIALVGSETAMGLAPLSKSKPMSIPISLTYRELNRKSNQLAHLLSGKGVKSDTIVGIMVERSVEMIIGILGILKAGGAYLPIIPGSPKDRVSYMLADSNARILVSGESKLSEVSEEIGLVLIDKAIEDSTTPPTPHTQQTCRTRPPTHLNLAYIIYTSGSTGKPKGVMVEHASAVNILSALQKEYPFMGPDVYLLKTSYIFDVSVTELFGWFFGEGRLSILEKDAEKAPWKILETIEKQGVTHINFVPSMFNTFVEALNRENIGKLSGLKYLFLAGEALLPGLVDKFRSFNTAIALENIYGPTEGTVYSSRYSLCRWKGRDSIPIGKPLSNIRLYILNPSHRLQPVGVHGELCIGGAGVARGYLNRPGLTAEKFRRTVISHLSLVIGSSLKTNDKLSKVTNDKCPMTNDRLYHTGDLCRRLPGGNIEFLGRMDHQVKIRGFRVELGEIESRLLDHPSVKESVVTSLKNQSGDTYICAYVVSPSSYSTSSPGFTGLKEYLSQTLPDYMIPAYFVKIEEIPLKASGKPDCSALPQPEIKAAAQYTAPRNEQEELLVEIWSRVLGIDKEKIGIDDNFFELGGHSLKAAALASRIHRTFSIMLPLGEIFKNSFIRKQSAYIKKASRERYHPIEAVEEKEFYSLSMAQKRLFILDQMEPQSTTYNLPGVFILGNKLDLARLEKAFRQLTKRHESFRTSFITAAGSPVQKINKTVKLSYKYYEPADTGDIESVMKGFVRPFDLSQAPLLRVGLLKTNEEKFFLLVDMHHIIADGFSIGILQMELAALYLLKELPSLRIQYKDYSEQQRKEVNKVRLHEQEVYWLKEFVGEIPLLNLPCDYARPPLQDFTGRTASFEIGPGETGALKELAQKENTTLYMIILAIYNILLMKLSSQEDFVVGTAMVGRSHADLEHVVGMFVNTLPLRNQPGNHKTCKEFLKELNEKTLNAFENQDYPFEELVERVSVTRDASRNPLFDVMFNFQEREATELGPTSLTITPYEFENQTSKFDMTFTVEVTDEPLLIYVEYSTKLFKPETILRFIGYFRKIIFDVIGNIDKKISGIEIISGVEKKQILDDFNDTRKEYPSEATIHELFEQEVAKRPDNIAVVGAGPGAQDTELEEQTIHLTYTRLNRASNQLARLLRTKGVKADAVVGIMMDRSIEMIIGVLGIIKAGGGYLPIDPGYPEERKKYMLADSDSKLLLTEKKYREQMKGVAKVLPLEHINQYPDHRGNQDNLESLNQPDDLVYVIYTSGSTGKPKGVMVVHGNVVRLVKNTNYIEFKENDRLLQTGALEFDASTFEIWGSLLNGLILYIAHIDEILAPGTLKEMIRKYKIHTMWLTSPLFNQLTRVDTGIFAGLRNLLVGGDVLSPVHINKVRKRFPGLNIINGYGPTENTTFSTTFLIKQEYQERIPIGSPIANSFAYIVDNSDYLLPIGVAGELWVGGDGVSRGYLNNPALTAEKFQIPNPKTQIPNFKPNGALRADFRAQSHIYRTGDLARWLCDGSVEFLGRMDQQVKIRGFRIEPGEIENQLLDHNDIKEAVVMTRENSEGDKYICAYIVTTMEPDSPPDLKVSELRDYLSKRLPDYMIPSYFLRLDKIPLTPNGKVDRGSLPKPGLESGKEYAAPRDDVEKKLADIWSEVLARDDEPGIDDNFFELGGHSLKATILISKIHKALHVKTPLAEIFKNPTIREFRKCIAAKEKEKYLSIENVEKRQYYVLSSSQQRLYILNRMESQGTVYNIFGVFLLEGELDLIRLEEAFRKLVQRHESFRTFFITVEEQPMQRIRDTAEFEFEGQDGQEPVHASTIKNFIRPFDLSRAPLLRGSVIPIENGKHLLIVDMHHIIADGFSIGILQKEMAALYSLRDLPPLRIQYKDYSMWQRREANKVRLHEQEVYWLKEFAGEIPVLSLPYDFTRSPLQGFAGRTASFEIGPGETGALKDLARKENTTLYMTILAIYNILLMKLSTQEDIVVGTAVAGRRHADVEPVVGMFVNTLPLRNQPGNHKTCTEFLKELRKKTLNAFENQDYPFEELVEQVSVTRDASRNPLFDVMFNLQDRGAKELEMANLKMSPYQYENNTAKFDLTIIAVEENNQVQVHVEYSTKLFKHETIQRFTRYFKKIISSVLENPGARPQAIEIISDKEKRRLLVRFNDTAMDYPSDKTIHRLFEEQVKRTPDSIATVGSRRLDARLYGAEQQTYRELNERANQLARLLRLMGVKVNSIVGLMTGRSVEMIIGLMAVLKAGGAYIPIGPEYPGERITYMLKECHAGILLLDAHRNPPQCTSQLVKADDPGIYRGDVSNLPGVSLPTDLSYVIFTSGTTGKPKGVMIENKSLVNFVIGITDVVPFTGNDRILSLTTLSFDIFGLETLLPLLCGSRVVIGSSEEQVNAGFIASHIKREKITIFQVTPSRLQLILAHGESAKSLGVLNYLLVGGEAFPPVLLEETRAVTKAKIYNVYGPTETTIWSTIKDVSAGNALNIGKPIANTRVYILSKEGAVQPLGVPGELCIAGEGVGRGYFKDDELTNEKFAANPFVPGDRMYKTGDLAKWLPDGNLDFLGRMDHQVKIRGFRVELGEIENHLHSHDNVKEAVVITRGTEENKYLCAYVTVSKEFESLVSQLRDYLALKLPAYMIPTHFVQIDRIPLTANGKIDRKALPQPQSNHGSEYIAPRNESEELLVEIWAEVLGLDKEGIGIDDNFFELGGHSLKAISMTSKIQEKLKVEIPLTAFISHPSVRKLAGDINGRLVDEASPPVMGSGKISGLVHTQDGENLHQPFPLTHIQAAYLMGRSDQFDIGGISTHFYLEVNTHLDIRRLTKSFGKIIARHPMMRVIVTEDGKQKILEEVPGYEIKMEDLAHLAPAEQDKRILKERERISCHIFDLSQWPLFEIKAFKLSRDDLYLCIGFDVLMVDAHSFELMVNELMMFYRQPELELQPLEFTFRDYILGIEEFRNSAIYAAARDYWLNKLEDFPPAPRLPLVCKPSAIKKPTFKRCLEIFSKEESETLQRIARENNTTASVLLCTAYARVLAYWSNQTEFALNLTLFNRRPLHKDVNKILGNFTSVILLDVDWDPGASFMEMAENIRHRLMEALEHRHYDGVEFIRDIARYNNLGTQTVMPVVFNSTVAETGEADFHFGDELADVRTSIVQTSQVFIDNHSNLQGDRLVLAWDYVEELFAPHTITTMFYQYTGIIRALLLEEENHYRLQPSEQDRELWEIYNKTAGESPALLLHQLFTRQVAVTPGSIALEYGDDTLTYRQLDGRSNQVAAYLKGQGVKPNDRVAVLTTRSTKTIVNVIGVLKAGGAYVPIEPHFPQERQDYIYTNSGCKLWVEPELYQRANLAVYPSGPIEHINTPQDMAYVIYTSGSTGRPKGVIITHQEAANTIIDINRKFNVNESDRILGISSMCFDLSVYDVFGALSTGARLVLISTQKDIDILIEALDTKAITLWNSVPAILDMVVNHLEENYVNPHLTRALLSGDWIPLTLAGKTGKHFPNCDVISLGGATEGSIWSIFYPIKEVKKEWKSIPYGYPLTNQAFYVLNFHQQLCPVGVTGELYIGGAGVAEGYINDEEKTNLAFLNHPNFGRIYKTGDYGVLQPGGYIEFLGRKDLQVKIRGYRIELGEIESCILEHKAIKSAVVTDRANPHSPGAKYLCAYIVPHDPKGRQQLVPVLKDFLSQKLPDYMIPSFFIQLDEFPLTGNGKVDYKRLPAPGETDLEITPQYAAPRTPLEQKLVEIWGTVLGKDSIGIHDHFFMIGGDSIKTIQVAALLKREEYRVEMRDFFRYPTISELTPNLKKSGHIPDQSLASGTVPLTPIQKYFFEKVKVDSHHFNQAVMLFSKQRLETEVLEAVFKKFQQHHDALRMTFRQENGSVVQTNHGPDYPLSIKEYDYRGWAGETSVEQAVEARSDEIQASIDLEKGPLMKLGLFHLDDSDYLLIVVHHLVIDGVSWRILFEDVTTLYKQIEQGKTMALPLKTTSFKEWSQKLQTYSTSDALLEELQYWMALEQSELPPLFRTGTDGGGRIKDTKEVSFELPGKYTEQLLTEVNRAYNTEINDILVTALGLALSQWAGVEKVLIELEGHGREEIIKDVDITRTIGWFTSIYPVVLDMGGQKACDLSTAVKYTKEMLRRIPNRGVGYGMLKYVTPRENKQGATFNLKPAVSFNYLGKFDRDVNTDIFEAADISTGHSIGVNSQLRYPLEILGIVSKGKLKISAAYNGEAIDEKEMKTFMNRFETRLKEIIAHCAAQTHTQFTLSDFTSRDITAEELKSIYRELQGVNESDVRDIYSLSPMQAGMLFHYLDKTSTAYVEQMSFQVHGEIDFTLLNRAFNRLVERHDVLRTVFVYKNTGNPRQVVVKKRKAQAYFEDISRLNQSEKTRYIKNFKNKDKEAGVDLSNGMPLRYSLLKRSKIDYEIIMTFHHIIMDGWCSWILLKELLTLYIGLTRGEPVDLPSPPGYKNYIKWLEVQDKQEGVHYWKNYLEDFDTPSRIPRFTEGKENQYEQARVEVKINHQITGQLNRIAIEKRVTLNAILQALWGILLQKYNNTDDVVFGFVASGRPAEIPGIETMIGLFINTVPMRVRSDANEPFDRLVKKVRDNIIRSKDHEHIPLAEIQNSSPLKRDLLNHILIFENYPLDKEIEKLSREGNPGFTICGVEVYEQTNYDLDVIIVPGEELQVILKYNSIVYNSVFMSQIGEHLVHIMEKVVNNPGIPVGEIEILDEDRKNQLLYQFNQTEAGYPREKTLHELFREQVELTADHIAVVGPRELHEKGWPNRPIRGNIHLTYQELDEKSNHLTLVLKEKGVQVDKIVGIMAGRSIEMVIGIWGILKSGGAYLPIDANLPGERIQYMLADSNAEVLVTTPKTQAEVKAESIEIIEISNLLFPSTSTVTSACRVSPANLAYVLYTSGTTGKPKGVMINHQGIVNYIYWAQKYYVGKEQVNFPLFTSISFDLTLTSLFTPLISGHAVIIYGAGHDEFLVDKIIDENRIGLVKLTPSHLKMIREKKMGGRNSSIKRLVVGGENLETHLAEDIFRNFNGTIEIYNEYGPTETVVGSMIYQFRPAGMLGKSVPIGVPIANTRIYILDNRLRPVPPGVPGEICIGGEGPGRGYLNRPQLTAEKFISFCGKGKKLVKKSNKISRSPRGDRLYRTGDLARRLLGGNIEFLGRRDNQVKIRGFRIEPSEIEYRLSCHENIKEAVVVVREPRRGDEPGAKSGEKRLYAYIVSDREFTVPQLREYLSGELPVYMIPSYFVRVEKIPLTPHGKVDGHALPEPGGTIGTGVEYAAPGNDTEELIANIWKDVLNLEKIGIDDNFSDLGGTSINIIRLMTEIKKAIQIDVTVVEIFRYTTIRSFAGYLLTREGHGIDSRGSTGERKVSKARARQRQTVGKNKRRQGRNARS